MFLFHSILDAQKQFLKVFAGDWYEAHLEACKFVEQVYGVPISEPADVVIASCGGILRISISISCKRRWIMPGVLLRMAA